MPDKVKVDTASGSRTFNRFEIQISQVLHLAIELYDNLNYLFVLDHYDDITLFDLEAEPLAVSYYQMKTSDEKITIESAIKENWISKLYAQLNRPEEWLVKELGLITNMPLELKIRTVSDKKGKQKTHVEKLKAERTQFTSFHESIQKKIKADIAKKCHISENEVDLSKLAHMRTTLTITNHRDLVEKEMSDFLYNKHPKITVDTVKSIFAAMIELLTRRQACEDMPKNAALEEVQKHKGITKNDFTRVIDQAICVTIPEFPEVERLLQPKDKDKANLSLAWVRIVADSNNRNDQSFYELFKKAQNAIKAKPFDGSMSIWDYTQEIACIIRTNNPILCVPYDDFYIPVLITCLLINETRRTS